MLRILSFETHKHPILGGNTFDLTNPEEDKSDNYYSIIIGPNGTGKSYLLSSLIDAFNEITLLRNIPYYKSKRKFSLRYLLNGSEYTVSTENKEHIILKNGNSINISNLEVPNKWIAVSATINDKYPILNSVRKKQIPQYKYLGIRSASNNAFISRITTNTVLYFLDALRKKKHKELLSVYMSLGLSPEVEIIFTSGPMLKIEKRDGVYNLYKNENKLIEPHFSFIKKNKSLTNYRADNYKRHIGDRDSISAVLKFMQLHKDSFEKKDKTSIQIRYIVNLLDNIGAINILHDWDVLSIMLDLDLISISNFVISKKSAFRYEEASSGESHLLTSLHGIVANIEDNSLLVIDEPEISLHPNWQVDYIDILKSLINIHTGVNIVISSHSHLMVSSLKNEESRISSIRRNKESNKIEIEELDFETYGWDPESILYNVFGVATTRNKYFDLDLRKLIYLISTKSDNRDEIFRLKEKVAKYIMPNEDDPLRLVILQVENYLNN